MDWFHDARFGMFIHWGLYSMLGRGTWVMHNDCLSVASIESLADGFTAERCDPARWAAAAADAGMRYAVFTARHHDGFCLFDSAVSDFTSVRSPARRDFVAEYVAAFRAAGIRVGLYYSLLDWRFPGYFEPERYPADKAAMVAQAHAQVRELLTNYGKIDLLWFDGNWMREVRASFDGPPEVLDEFWRTPELVAMIRELQPDVIINDRSGGYEGDYDTPEQSLKASRPGRAWELCETIGDYNQAWAHQRFTPRPIRKSAGQILLELVTVAKDEGNLLLNVGPTAEGEIIADDLALLSEIGAWMRSHGEAIHGSARSPIRGNSVGYWTFVGRVGYLCLGCWPGNELVSCDIDGVVESVEMLATGDPVDHVHDPVTGRFTLTGLPDIPPHLDVNVIKVQFRDVPQAKQWDDRSWWLQSGAR